MSKVKFIESSHRYLLEDKEMISVSKFIEQFKNKQNWDLIAERVAKKLTKEGTPTTKTEVLAKWEKKRVVSTEIGTAFHLIKENELINDPSPSFYGKECKKLVCHTSDEYKYSLPINQLTNNTVYPEMMIYDEEHMICGQADKVIITNHKINIWDYKTDQEIKFRGYSSQWKAAEKMKAPLSHIEECNGNIYSLKMSLYMYMLWKANKGKFLPGDLIIEHVTLKRDIDNDNIAVLDKNGHPIVLSTEQISLPYRKKEVIALLKTLK